MHGIVSISGTSRPGNFTSRALAVVNDELTRRGSAPEVFDARELTLSFPGLTPTADAERLEEAIRAATGVVIASPDGDHWLVADLDVGYDDVGVINAEGHIIVDRVLVYQPG